MLISILDDNRSESALAANFFRKRISGVTTLEFDDEAIMMKYLKRPALLPDLILIELQIPGLDVWHIVQELRNGIATKHIPIAFYSRSKNPKNFLFASRLNVPLFIKGDKLEEKDFGEQNLIKWYRNLQVA